MEEKSYKHSSEKINAEKLKLNLDVIIQSKEISEINLFRRFGEQKG